MNIFLILLFSLVVFYLGYRFYARFISGIFGADDNNVVPSKKFSDGKDFVPTRLGVAFSHHFASIAGAGPIIGPTVAMLFGVIPVWVWILFGTIFIGAVHDYTALFTSMRESGKSMAEVARTNLGKAGFLLFIAFTTVMILLVTSAFLGLSATSLTSLVPVKDMMIDPSNTVLKTITNGDGVVMAQIGGISSTSVIILCLFAPIIGWLLYKKNVNAWIVTVLAIIVCVISITVGVFFPVSLPAKQWMIILSIYVVIAAGIPVWVLLQPRDFMNSFILYIGIAFLIIGVAFGGITGMSTNAPLFNIAEGNAKVGCIWPFLFITVACGAISGFHSLVASGTVSKQISKESDAIKVGYGGMVLEGILALLVLLALAGGLDFETYTSIVYPAKGGSNPVLAFALAMGNLLHNAIKLPIAFGTVFGILMVEGFVVTTLDTAVRLNRYLFEELWTILFKKVPALLKSYIFNAVLASALMLWLSWTNTFALIWPIFGTANQLLAALALIAVSAWLSQRHKPTLFTLIPAVFMVVTTICSLVILLINVYIPKMKYALIVTDVLLLALSFGVIYIAVRKIFSFSSSAKSA